MNHKPTALVIGAGIGGIATAARLAKNGYDVTVLEKESTPGGRCNQIVRDGHRFDIGPTLFLMPEIWEDTFASLGERMSDHLDLKRIDPTYKVHFDDGLQLELTSDIGGMYAGIQALVKIAERLGVKFIYNSPVKRLKVAGSKVEGVELNDGREHTADTFVGNADLPYIYKELLPDVKEAKKLDDKKYTCSTIMFYWGVDKEYKQIAHHNVFLGGEYKASFDKIFDEHTLPEAPSFYIHAPARTDSAAAPEGQDTLYALVPVGHLDARSEQDWDAMINRARETVLTRLADEKGATDLKEHIKFEIVYQPKVWKERFNLVNGSAFGLSHNFTQVGYLRPQNRHKQYKNLYFAGASTHPGTGLPIVLLSAKLTTQRILKEVGTISVQNMINAVAAVRA